MNKFLKRIGFAFCTYIGRNKICDGLCLTILPSVMLVSDEQEITFVIGWLFWQIDVYYTR